MLLALGEVMLELNSLIPLATTTTLQKHYGGDVINTLLAAQHFALKGKLVTRVGQDIFGPALLEAWKKTGLDVTHCWLHPGQNGLYLISVDEHGEREFTYYRQGSAASTMTPDAFTPDIFNGVNAVLLSGITQALSVGCQAATLHLAQQAHLRGLPIYYDPNYRPALWKSRGGLSAARQALQEVIPYVTVLLPSDPADRELLQVQHSRDYFNTQVNTVVVKNGPNGAFTVQNDQMLVVPTQPIRPLDSTGAGDAWNGAFIAHHIQGTSLKDAILFANQHAIHALKHLGAVTYLKGEHCHARH